MRSRFDVDLLDPVDSFEIDEHNIVHLFKHGMSDTRTQTGLDVLTEVYFHDEPLFYEAEDEGPADWLMLGEATGEVVTVPLAPPRSGLPTKCRPIGLYRASVQDRVQYFEDLSRWREQ